MSVRVLHGDCREVLAGMEPDTFDSCCTDPPYHLTSIVKRFGGTNAAPAKSGKTGAYARASRGFMGKQWDGGDVAFQPETWVEVLRVLKPGGHLVAFGGTRTFHRMAVAIEDAGFEVRDTLFWAYGSGFPKSHSIDKAIDKTLGMRGEYGEPKSAAHAGWIDRGRMRGDEGHEGYQRPWMEDEEAVDRAARRYIPATPEAAAWEGWGTALKPAVEPIILARKPLSEGSVAANVLRWGTGAINVDGCRVAGGKDVPASPCKTDSKIYGAGSSTTTGGTPGFDPNIGRWPPNLLHDGSPEVLEAFGLFGKTRTAGNVNPTRQPIGYMSGSERNALPVNHHDSGTAARFFPALGLGPDDLRFWYGGKADADDRLGSKHPTVKPIELMRWLVRLVTPPGGAVLDPFAGTGTTGAAALMEGCTATLIEREAEYVADIERRLGHMRGADTPLFAGAAA